MLKKSAPVISIMCLLIRIDVLRENTRLNEAALDVASRAAFFDILEWDVGRQHPRQKNIFPHV